MAISLKGSKTKDAKKEKAAPKEKAVKKSKGSPKDKKAPKGMRGKMPTKRSINLIVVDESKIELKKAIPLIIIIVVLAVLFSKFLVIDRINEVNQATARVSQLRSDLDTMNAAIQTFGELQEKYAHYTYSGMTAEEMERVDRVSVMELAETIFASGNQANSWSLSGNILTAEVVGDTLEDLNKLAEKLEENPIVDRCAITTANKADITKDQKVTGVRASFTVYLQQPIEEEGEAQ